MNMTGCMFLGFDVCRDKRDRSRSYSALVSTMDLKAATARRPKRFFRSVAPCTNGEELSDNLSLNVTKALTIANGLW